jgi:hypothetical protein
LNMFGKNCESWETNLQILLCLFKCRTKRRKENHRVSSQVLLEKMSSNDTSSGEFDTLLFLSRSSSHWIKKGR